uniref:Putative neurotoxin LTDF 04-01 n=1 Tax=Dolomedes fimbriatus TaxID=1432569 RepID=A0A0K1D8T9_9ARAC|nr:putative neurotoxin LTDF 04-01 [Dolomedes fimbriatus]
MFLKIQLLLIAITLISVLAERAEPDSSENTQLVEDEERSCREPNESCWYPSKPCCKNRACKCGLFFNNCECYQPPSEIFGK